MQELPSGRWLEWDLPLSGAEISHELSGPGGLSGEVPVEVARLLTPEGAPLLLPWGCAIWAEASGQIRGGGILTRVSFDGSAMKLECVGLSGYASGQPWLGEEYRRVQIDPLTVVRTIWNHLQGEPGGDLGLVLDGTKSPVRVGNKEEDVEFQTGAGEDVAFEAGPFKMDPWSTGDVGKVVDDLAASTPFDYVTHTSWDGDSDRLKHRLELTYPRRGSRRDDLRFVVGENVTVDPSQVLDGDEFASQVLVLGSGDGRDMVRADVSARRGRLRRVVTVEDKSAGSKRKATSVARRELAARAGSVEITDVEVADTPLAPVGSLVVGDEIRVQSDAGWLELDLWVRVLEINMKPEDLSVLSLRVARSEGVIV